MTAPRVPRAIDFTQAIAALDRETDAMAAECMRTGVKMNAAGAFFGMTGRFFSVYFLKGARKNGVDGLFTAVNEGMKVFLTYAKIWEKKQRNEIPR